MFDWRGQGASDRQLKIRYKGHVDHFACFDDDLVSFMEAVVMPDCPPPYFALAQSMGANIVLRALDKRTWFSRVVAFCPLVQLMPASVPWPLVRMRRGFCSVCSACRRSMSRVGTICRPKCRRSKQPADV